MATDHVVEEGEVVMDSLGQMKKLSKWAIFENQAGDPQMLCAEHLVTWCLGQSWQFSRTGCAIDMDSDNQYYPFCTTLARTAVKPWSEILVRSLGNDQDLFGQKLRGFIMLGAYQDSRPATPGGPPSVKFGMKDFFVFIVYMAMALPLPQILHFIFREYAWPIDWGGGMAPTNEWGWSYMQARLYLEICERIKATSAFCPILLLKARAARARDEVIATALLHCQGYPGGQCKGVSFTAWQLQMRCWKAMAQQLLWWIFRNFGTGCPMYMRWVSWYLAFYVWSFHYLRPAVALLSKRLPKVMMALLVPEFHYPNNVLEKGTGMAWASPSRLGMTYVPVDLAWWGNTTLGAYVFHFYFRDHAAASGNRTRLMWNPLRGSADHEHMRRACLGLALKDSSQELRCVLTQSSVPRIRVDFW
ncbi:unnamed protein product [Symbiodinium microadriaticum]|nr:unnamed protein product [Symbiodinium sp. KB8]CAE7527482.1 unnamed protein product [Symbiodinium microadriaticum]